ncbi:PAS domain-containing protein, partial [Staphylococcus aureus]|uniref:PAS domain-containing protein n=1 Tax=Staphylococcus aureus TaxID=1280 RepID=UPI0032B4720E
NEALLRESHDRFRAAVEAVQGILWTNDAAGRMVGEQPGWSALTGQTQAEYEGYGWAKAVHPDDAQPTIDAWEAAVAESRMFVF